MLMNETTAADGATTITAGDWAAHITPTDRFGYRSVQLHHRGRPVGDFCAHNADRALDSACAYLRAKVTTTTRTDPTTADAGEIAAYDAARAAWAAAQTACPQHVIDAEDAEAHALLADM